jgi:hypothetical protein
VGVFQAVNAVVFARQRAGVLQSLPQRLVENLVDKRALARPGCACDCDEHAEREGHVNRLEIVLSRAAHHERLAVTPSPLFRRYDRTLAREELPRRRRLAREHVVKLALYDNIAAVDSGTGAHLHDVVGRADRVLVMLDDDHRVADVAQPFERRDHLYVVLWVQADARFVEDVKHSHQPRPDLR